MPLAPKLAATALVAATVATLSVLSTPAYAESGETPDSGGGSNVQELIADVKSEIFRCHVVYTYDLPISHEAEVCVRPLFVP